MENLKLVDAGLDSSVVYDLYTAPTFSNLNRTTQAPVDGPRLTRRKT